MVKNNSLLDEYGIVLAFIDSVFAIMDRYRSEMSTASDVSGALSSAEVTATTLRDSLLAELGPHNPHPDW